MQIAISSASRTLGILVCVVAAQVVVAGAWRSEAHLAWVVAAALLHLAAGVTAAFALLDQSFSVRERLLLAVAVGMALWLLLVQFGSVAPARGLFHTWAWWSALWLVPVACLAVRERWSVWLLAALVLPLGLDALWRAWLALTHSAGHLVTGVDPNVLADRLAALAYLAVFGFVVLSARMRARTVGFGLLVVLVLFGVLLAVLLQQGLQARAVMVGILFGLGLLAWTNRRPMLWLVPAAMLAIYMLTALWPDLLVVSATGTAVDANRFAADRIESATGQRGALWSAAWTLHGAGSLTGTGLNTFGVLYASVRGSEDGTTGTFVHNDFLQLALEAGWPFLLVLVGIVLAGAVALLAALERLRREATWQGPAAEHLLAVVALLTFVFIAGHAIINFPLYDPGLLHLATAALVIGWLGSRHISSPLAPGGGRRWRVLLLPVALSFVGLWLVVASHAFSLVVLNGQRPLPFMPAVELTDAEHYAWSERLHRLGVGYGVPAYMHAGWAAAFWQGAPAQTRARLEEVAAQGYEEAIARQPWQVDFYVAYARFLAETGRADAAERLEILETARLRNPAVPGVWLELARQLESAGLWQQRVAELAPIWMQHCRVLAVLDEDAFAGFYRMIPAEVLANHPGLAGRCQQLIEHPPAARYR